MRWTKEEPKVHRSGDCRIIRRFLLMPHAIGLETRWLEQVTILQRINQGYVGDAIYVFDWQDVCFLDDPLDLPKILHGLLEEERRVCEEVVNQFWTERHLTRSKNRMRESLNLSEQLIPCEV